MIKARKLSGLILIILSSACGSRRAWQHPEIPAEHESFLRKAFPGSGAVILKDEGLMELSGDSRTPVSLFEHHRVIRIIDSRGWSSADITIPYDSHSEVESIMARTLSPDGKVTVLNPDKIYDITTQPDFVFYSDQRAKRFALPAVENGCLIEYRYRVRVRGLAFWHAWSFQDLFPVLTSRFTLIKPADWHLRYRVINRDVEPWEGNNPENTQTTLIWETHHVPPYVVEPSAPPFRETGQWLSIAPAGIETWDDVGKWYHALSEPAMSPDRNIRRLAEELTRTAENPADKWRILFEWVRDHIRYLAVSIGIGHIQPHPAGEVLQNRYGDCKDMTALLTAMARSVNLQADPALVSTWWNGVPDTSLATPLGFNHAVLCAPLESGDTLWLDPTEKLVSFGTMPWFNQGVFALKIDENGSSELIRTPESKPKHNHSNVRFDGTLNEHGWFSLNGTLTLTGAPAQIWREKFFNADSTARRRLVENWLAARWPASRVKSVFWADDQNSDTLTVRMRFTCPLSRLEEGGMGILSVSTFHPFPFRSFFETTTRRHPVRFTFGTRETTSLNLHLDSPWRAESTVRQDSVVSPFGWSKWRVIPDDSLLTVKMIRELAGKDIPAHRMADFKQFLDDLLRRDLRPIQIISSKKSRSKHEFNQRSSIR
ncbi:MAG TPA: DUF3857 domain-containing protein [bacterium]|nr:DUF3857 domain-containing protein [bacterium]